MKKLLLYGVGTFKNHGVEAIIKSFTDQIDTRKYEINVATHDYLYNKKLFSNKVNKYIKHYKKSNELNTKEKALENKYKKMPFDYNNFELLYQNDVVNTLENMDINFSVGGDNYCYDFPTWLYALDNKSHSLNKRTVLLGASLFEEIDDEELIEDLNKFDVLVIRESLSLEAVKKVVPDYKLLYIPDPAFSLKPKKVELNSWYKNRKILGLNLSPLTLTDNKKYKSFVEFVDYILKNTDYSICLLPHVTNKESNDLDILRKIKTTYKNEERIYLENGKYDCQELKYIISKFNLFIVARTHASIAAYSQAIPTLVIGYSVKSKGIAKDLFGTYDNYVISKDVISTDRLINSFNFLESNSEDIRKKLEKSMPKIIEESSKLFDKIIEKITIQDKLRICSKSKCVGCGLCKTLCPKNAITMEKGIDGFLYPKIDLSKCIECNICRKNCPINKDKQINNEKYKFYAVKNKNNEVVKVSTSGGIFTSIAKQVLKQKGIVYGCTYKKLKTSHIRINKEKDIIKINGSKYTQSNILDIIPSIKKDLSKNKLVLFSGTPCQVGMIKSHFDSPNLITVSVVCHGVLNDEIIANYKKYLEKTEKDTLIDIKFRTKENGWTKSSIKYIFKNKTIINKFMDDDLMRLFLTNLVLRESCYKCSFKGNNNPADIIIGDCWGIETTNKKMYDEEGISLVTCRTEKGKKLFNNIKSDLDIAIEKEENVKRFNPSFYISVKKPVERNYIFNEIYREFKIMSDKYFYKTQTKNYLNQLKEQEKELNRLVSENNILHNRLIEIYNSKRWKVTESTVNTINRLLGRNSK